MDEVTATTIDRACFSFTRARVTLASLLLGLFAGNAVAQVEPGISDIERVVAVADIHGAYDAFAHILRRAELIDASNSWSGERTHLVIVGDVLDRGAESRRALDLIRRLETEAEAAGGRVHFVLGNHEIMNLAGDLRYVAPGEYAAFADEEPLELRERERARYIEALGTSTSPDDASAMFDEAYPLGFFAHRAAFAHDGEYGEWLLGKPVLKVVNGVAFVHGGLTGAMLEHGSDLNHVLMSELEDVLVARDNLIAAGVLSPTSGLYELPLHAQALLEQQQQEDTLSPALQASLERLLAVDSLVSFAPDGPVWYRGSVGCNRLTEQDRLAAALRAVGAARLVVGHTPTRGAVVLSRMSESLLRIDTGMLSDYYGGRASALVIENGALSVLYEDEAEPSVPLAQPRRVGTRPAGLSAEDIEALLRGANFTLPTPFEASATYVRVVDGDRELRALFTVAEDDDRNGAVAAYRLDRLLGLDMVPVTVAREVSGVVGALQFWPDASIDETERSTERLGSGAWCPLPDQFSDMYLFDALIFNEARSADRIRYSTDNFGLLLVANDQTFAPERERPAYLANLPVELTPAWRTALEGLTEENLTAALGDVLDRRRIRALLARRDHLLEIAR